MSIKNRGERVQAALIQSEKGEGNMTLFLSGIFREKVAAAYRVFKCKDCNAVPNASCSSITLLWKKKFSHCAIFIFKIINVVNPQPPGLCCSDSLTYSNCIAKTKTGTMCQSSHHVGLVAILVSSEMNQLEIKKQDTDDDYSKIH